MKTQIKFKKLHPEVKLPQKATEGSSGFDLYAFLESPLILHPNVPTLIATGFSLEMPIGYEAQIRPRSGLSSKGIAAAFGTIDSDYRGEIRVNLTNLKASFRQKQYLQLESNDFIINPGDRIAQLVFSVVPNVEFVEVEELSETGRIGGFGSTGI